MAMHVSEGLKRTHCTLQKSFVLIENNEQKHDKHLCFDSIYNGMDFGGFKCFMKKKRQNKKMILCYRREATQLRQLHLCSMQNYKFYKRLNVQNSM